MNLFLNFREIIRIYELFYSFLGYKYSIFFLRGEIMKTFMCSTLNVIKHIQEKNGYLFDQV